MSITTDLMDFPQKSSRSFSIEEELKGVKWYPGGIQGHVYCHYLLPKVCLGPK